MINTYSMDSLTPIFCLRVIIGHEGEFTNRLHFSSYLPILKIYIFSLNLKWHNQEWKHLLRSFTLRRFAYAADRKCIKLPQARSRWCTTAHIRCLRKHRSQYFDCVRPLSEAMVTKIFMFSIYQYVKAQAPDWIVLVRTSIEITFKMSKTLKNTFESWDLNELPLIIHTSNFFVVLKKSLRPWPSDCISGCRQRRRPQRQKTCCSSLCASAGVDNRSGRCAVTSWNCSDTSWLGEVASLSQISCTSVAFLSPRAQ